MTNSLEQLADEYACCVCSVQEQIDSCRLSRRLAREKNRNKLVGKLDANLKVLYAQRAELEETERQLRNYYRHSKGVFECAN